MFVGVKSKNHFPDHESAARGYLGPVQLRAGNSQSEENKVHSEGWRYSSFLLLFLSFLFSCKFFRSDITFKVFRTHII